MSLHDPISPLRALYVQKVLPAVYDDSLSYYEVLAKTQEKLNEVISDTNDVSALVLELQQAINDFIHGGYTDTFEEYLDEWFNENADEFVQRLVDEGIIPEVEDLQNDIESVHGDIANLVAADAELRAEDVSIRNDMDTADTAIRNDMTAVDLALTNTKVPYPLVGATPSYGTSGQVLATNADGTTEWQDPIVPSDAQAEQVITQWLDAHPEATTTVQDGAITTAKLADGSVTDAKLVQSGGVLGDVGDLKGAVSKVVTEESAWDSIALDVHRDGYYNVYGTFIDNDTTRRYAIVAGVSEGEEYKLDSYTSSRLIPAVLFFNNNTLISYEKAGTGTPETVTGYEFEIPSGCNKIIVQAADLASTFALYEKVTQYISKSYTKAETDVVIASRTYTKAETDALFSNTYTKSETNALVAGVPKRYGIKWSIADTDDLGTRVLDSVGLNATIGIGSTDGYSDFDSIYPWSEIKRCNISQNANGAKIVTFEGETGFALDGTNGDVFVRIPKFYCERYQEDGYEYRVISGTGESVHPAFVEDGTELNEIFVGAFEGFVGSDNKLHSKGGVIPTSNITPQDFLDKAQANGSEYSLYDMRCIDAIWTLMAVEFGKRNTNRIIGYGLCDFTQPINEAKNMVRASANNTNTVRTNKWTSGQKELLPVGSNITICKNEQTTILTQAKLTSCVDTGDYTDWTFDGEAIDVDTTCFIGSAAFSTNFCEDASTGALNWHTGRASWVNNSSTRNPVRYRWIENVVGNLWHYLPDITFNNLQMYQCINMKDYVMHKYTDTYKPVSALFPENSDNGTKIDTVGYNYWITTLDNNILSHGVCFGRTYDKSLTSVKAFGGYYYLLNGVMTIANGGGFDHYVRCNMLTQRAWIGATMRWYLYGARLIFKNI